MRKTGLFSWSRRLWRLAQPAVRTITRPIDETKLARLAGNVWPEAIAKNDRGAVTDNFALDHMLLQLKRSPEREAALEAFIDQLHDSRSASFHQWLTPGHFGAQYALRKKTWTLAPGS